MLACSGERDETRLTELGALLATLPVSPRYGKMLVVSVKAGVLSHAIVAVSCLTVDELFERREGPAGAP